MGTVATLISHAERSNGLQMLISDRVHQHHHWSAMRARNCSAVASAATSNPVAASEHRLHHRGDFSTSPYTSWQATAQLGELQAARFELGALRYFKNEGSRRAPRVVW